MTGGLDRLVFLLYYVQCECDRNGAIVVCLLAWRGNKFSTSIDSCSDSPYRIDSFGAEFLLDLHLGNLDQNLALYPCSIVVFSHCSHAFEFFEDQVEVPLEGLWFS